jgi:hypothetical protein
MSSLAAKEAEYRNSAIVQFMLGCDDGFTYGGLQAKFSPNEAKTRLADKAIQKARRRGWIAFTRERGLILWRPTETGRRNLNILSAHSWESRSDADAGWRLCTAR